PRAFACRLGAEPGAIAHGPLRALSPVGLLVAIAKPFKNNAVQRFSRGAGSDSAVSCRNIPFGRPLLVGGCDGFCWTGRGRWSMTEYFIRFFVGGAVVS